MMIGPSSGSTVPSASAPMSPTSAERRGHMWARKSRPGFTGAVSKAFRRYDCRPPDACGLRVALRCTCAASESTDDVEAEASATGIWRESNVQNVTGRGSRSAAARWIASTVRTGCVAPEFGGAVEARLVDGNDVDAFPVVADGAAQRVALAFEARRRVRRARAPRSARAPTRTSRRPRPSRRARPGESGRRGSGRAAPTSRARARQRTSATSRSSRVPTGHRDEHVGRGTVAAPGLHARARGPRGRRSSAAARRRAARAGRAGPPPARRP